MQYDIIRYWNAITKLYHGADISESVISQITDDVIDDVKAWQNRPLDGVYPIVYFWLYSS